LRLPAPQPLDRRLPKCGFLRVFVKPQAQDFESFIEAAIVPKAPP
jgi:hypothetical protein